MLTAILLMLIGAVLTFLRVAEKVDVCPTMVGLGELAVNGLSERASTAVPHMLMEAGVASELIEMLRVAAR